MGRLWRYWEINDQDSAMWRPNTAQTQCTKIWSDKKLMSPNWKQILERPEDIWRAFLQLNLLWQWEHIVKSFPTIPVKIIFPMSAMVPFFLGFSDHGLVLGPIWAYSCGKFTKHGPDFHSMLETEAARTKFKLLHTYRSSELFKFWDSNQGGNGAYTFCH